MGTEMTKAVDLQHGPYRTSYVGAELVRQSTPEEWEAYGGALSKLGDVRQWATGDWLADGKTHYGDGLYEKAAKITGLNEATLREYKHIADRFELLARSNKLSWKHHRVVSPLSREEQIKWLKKAEAEDMTVAQLREAIQGGKSSDGTKPRRVSLSAKEWDELESRIRSLWLYVDKPPIELSPGGVKKEVKELCGVMDRILNRLHKQ